MAVRPILIDENPILRARSTEVDLAALKRGAYATLISDMVETMYHAKGVGIAAPQVGENLRIFIAESTDGPIALINPILSKRSWKHVVDQEGCLSVPGKFDMVRRAKSVSVEAHTANGTPLTFVAKDFFARILQHEMDHLDGILFIDRVKEQKKK